jgi:hypothetical protein
MDRYFLQKKWEKEEHKYMDYTEFLEDYIFEQQKIYEENIKSMKLQHHYSVSNYIMNRCK